MGIRSEQLGTSPIGATGLNSAGVAEGNSMRDPGMVSGMGVGPVPGGVNVNGIPSKVEGTLRTTCVVQLGESLETIAAREYGDAGFADLLRKANAEKLQVVNGFESVKPGTTLVLPRGAAAQPTG